MKFTQSSLKNILTFNFVLVAILPLLIVGIIAIHSLTRSMEQEISNRNSLLSHALAGEIARFLHEPLGLLNQIAEAIQHEDLIRQDRINTYLNLILRNYPYFNRLEVLDTDGTVRYLSPYNKDYLGNNLSGQIFFRKTKQEKRPYWSATFLSFQTGQPTLTLTCPTTDGMVVGYLNLLTLNSVVGKIRLGTGGFAAVADHEGTFIAHPEQQYVSQRLSLYNLLRTSAVPAPENQTFFYSAEDSEHLGSISTVPLTGWIVLVSQPSAEAFAPVRKMRNLLLYGITGSILLAFLISLLTLLKTLRPLYRLTDTARQIARGNYNVYPGAGGYLEVDELAKDFQMMIQAIKSREKALQESEGRYRTLFEESPASLWEIDLSPVRSLLNHLEAQHIQDVRAYLDRHPDTLARLLGHISVVDVNRTTVQLYEVDSKADLLGPFLPRNQRLLADTAGPLLQEILIRLAEGHTYESEQRHTTFTGKSIDVLVRAAVPPGFRDTWSKVFISVYDLTERVRAESERKKLEEQFRQAQKMEALGTLAGGIAHDFNNLLMGIQGNTSLMMLDANTAQPVYQRLRNIEAHVRSATELSRQLLGLARGGKYEVLPSDLNELVRKTVGMFGRTKKEILIHPVYEDNLHTVAVDRGQIEQVLLNLFVNAWQAMPEGGHLYLRTENMDIDEATARSHNVPPGRYARLSVTDTGTGMDKETLQKIFDPFFTTKGMGRGTGLGLASAFGILRNHGGFITACSEPGHGATFHVCLPATEKASVKRPAEDPQVLSGSERILLVDDEEMVLEVAAEMLVSLGYGVHPFATGAEALAFFRADPDAVHLVILDMIMPDMSGEETFLRLREIDPSVRVLLSSGYSIDGKAAEILKQGCNGFIQKPFSIQNLSRKIRDILSTGRTGSIHLN